MSPHEGLPIPYLSVWRSMWSNNLLIVPNDTPTSWLLRTTPFNNGKTPGVGATREGHLRFQAGGASAGGGGGGGNEGNGGGHGGGGCDENSGGGSGNNKRSGKGVCNASASNKNMHPVLKIPIAPIYSTNLPWGLNDLCRKADLTNR